jgi:DNA modification methylase
MISQVINRNCLEELPKMPDASVDMVCSDPPYELNFMGKSWDNTGIAFDPKLYAELFRVLKPGGLIRMFSATRTYHRVCQAMSNAGFVDMRLKAWVYGSGFPKSLNVSVKIDDMAGAERSLHPATEDAEKWEGYGTALKPAWEVIVCARKPE